MLLTHLKYIYYIKRHVLVSLPLETISMFMLKNAEKKKTLRKSDKTKSCTSLQLLLKPGLRPWTLDLVPEKTGINIGLKNMSDFRELCFTKTIRNVSYCLKVRVLTDI